MLEKKFQKMSKLADDAYGMSSVLKEYCSNKCEIEEIGNLYPPIKHIHKDIDYLNAMFINFDEEE